MKTIVLAVIVVVLTACAVRMYGNVKCKGECEITVDREVRELEPLPDKIPIPEGAK